MHPSTKHWHLIEYAIVWRKDRQHARVTKTMCGADNGTDYRLVVSILDVIICPARKSQGQKAPKRLNVSKLKDDNKRQLFSVIFAQIGRIASQCRGSRRELDSISKRVSFFSCWYSRTKISQTLILVDENGDEITANTRYIKMILAQYPIRQATTTFLWLEQN